MDILLQFCTVGLLVNAAVTNQQSWSERTYLDRAHTFACNSTLNNITVDSEHRLSWTKLGSNTPLRNGVHYELLDDSGVANMLLRIRSVTSEMTGIYFCHIKAQDGTPVDRIVKGLNVAGHLYENKFDEYRSKVITGVISAASVFTIVVGIGMINRFRYLTDEQKQKRRERKEERIRRLQQQTQNGGIDNVAMDGGTDNVAMDGGLGSSYDSGFGSNIKLESNTHL